MSSQVTESPALHVSHKLSGREVEKWQNNQNLTEENFLSDPTMASDDLKLSEIIGGEKDENTVF